MHMAVRFSQDVFDAICERLADGDSLRKVCLGEDMPSTTAVIKWLAADEAAANKGEDGAGLLVAQYARARELQADAMFDDCLGISDDAGPETVQQARLRIDTRKWMAGKLRPKKYGEKVQQEVSGPDGGGIPLSLSVKFDSP